MSIITPKMTSRQTYQKGAVNGWMIATIGLIVAVLASGSLAIWGILRYQDQKTNVDGKIALAVADAVKKQADDDEEKFAQREKEPRREFASPDDLGRLSFDYPKTWSAYVDTDPADSKGKGDYTAYLHPIVVPPTKVRDQQFALRVSILDKNYDEYLKTWDRFIERGEVRSSAVTVGGENGVRIDGNLTKEIRGSAVVFKIRDKTAVIQTDADTFKHDFNDLIKTIKFIK